MAKVTRRVINPFIIARFAEFKNLKSTLLKAPRLCLKHNEAVSAHHVPFDNPGSSAPNFEIVFSGCCDEALEQEFEFINKALAEQKH